MRKALTEAVVWGFVLWLFGYILGIALFAFIPQHLLGWVIMPAGVFASLWVLHTKVRKAEFTQYILLSVVWTMLAIVLDYFFIVKFFKSTQYYKLDVYVYYVLTFLLPIGAGWKKSSSLKAR